MKFYCSGVKAMKIGVVVILSILVSCTHTGSVNNQYAGKPTESVLVLKDSIEFHLDKETVPLINYMQYKDVDSMQILSFVNDYNNKIYFFNYNTRQYMGVFPTGNTLKEKIQGYYIDNDSIYIYSYNSGKVYCYLFDEETFIKDFFIVEKQKKNYDLLTPHSYLTTISPMIKYGNTILSTGYRSGETKFETTVNRPVLTVYNINTDTLTYCANFPKQYSEYNWGGSMLFRLTYYTMKPDGTIVLSFPASHDLAITSINDLQNMKYVYGGSNQIKTIHSFPYRKGSFSYNNQDIWSWYLRTPSYEGILYDQYRNLYYRIARLANKECDPNEQGNKKPIIIIVLDDNLQYLGETILPQNLSLCSSNIFVSKEGLNIQVLSENEDILKFYRYDYAKFN